VLKREGRGIFVFRVASGLCALCLLAWTFRGVDFARVARCIASIGGAGLAVIAAPAVLALGLECIGWGRVFTSLGQRVALKPLLYVRLMTEALAQTLPMGVIWAESFKPALLARYAGVASGRAVAALVARKYLLMGSQAVSVAVLSAGGFATLQHLSRSFTGRAECAWLAFVVSAMLCLLALSVGGAFARGRVAERLLSVLRRLPNARFQDALRTRQQSFASTDSLSAGYFRAGFVRSTLTPGLFFLAGWLCEALESFLILKVLGVQIDFFAIASVEVMLSFLKSVFFVLPAGIGIQDLGYVSCLSALGVPDALTVGASFSALKRGKELSWAAIGYLLWASEARSTLASARQLSVDPA
jgi:Lysylphosphatidylglycerol synthase TM region